MAETHEQRIARLIELARKAWPYERVRVMTDDAGCACVVDVSNCAPHVGSGGEPDLLTDSLLRIAPQSSKDGERALDALEAALCVLAGEPSSLEVGVNEVLDEMRNTPPNSGHGTKYWGARLSRALEAAKGGAR
jgi:hypothetical protein